MSAAAGRTTAYDEIGAGAGGKFRRTPFRKHHAAATPYDRPPAAIRTTNSGSSSSGNGWVSKIVDPASRIITASAQRLFSSLLRKRLPPPPARQDPLEVNRTTYSVQRSEIQAEYGDQPETDHHVKEHIQLDNNGDNKGISELEKILAEKTFTESEINQLTALLNSRTIKVTAEKASEARAQKTVFEHGNSSEFKFSTVPDNGINSLGYLGATSSNVSKAEVIEEDIATPAELAKAYMGSRPLKVSPSMIGSRSLTTKYDLPLTNSAVFPSPSSFMRTAIKSLPSIGVPENGYITPRSRGRSAIYSMARTPYSRSQKGLKRRSNVLDDDIGSAGPIQKICQKPSLLSSQRLNEPAGGSSPINRPEVLSNYHSKNAGSRTHGENVSSVPFQSSIVAQMILQQLDKLSPSPKEKSSERKSMQQAGKSTFTLTTDILSRQALRSLEKVDSSKSIESSQQNSNVSDSVQRVATNEDFIVLNGINQLEENGPQKPTSASKNNSEIAFNSIEHHLVENKKGFQISAFEDYSGDNNGLSNDSSFVLAKDEVDIVHSLKENNLQMKSDQNGTVPSGSMKFEMDGTVSFFSGSPRKTIQPTATDNISPSLFGKVSSNEQTSMTPLFGHEAKVSDKLSPSTLTPSSPTANDSPDVQTSALPASRTVNLSRLSDLSKTKPDDRESTEGAGYMDAKPTTASNDLATTSALFFSGSFANNGLAKSSFPGQPASTSSSNGAGTCNVNSFASTTSATNVPNADAGIISSGVSLFSTSISPFSASSVCQDPPSRKDPQLSSGIHLPPSDVETEKPVNEVTNIPSNTFGGGGCGTSSATASDSHFFSGFGSSMSSPRMDNQALGSVSNAVSSQAKTTVADSIPQNTLFQFGSSGFPSAPTLGLSKTTNVASTITSLPAPMFGQNSLPSSKEAGGVGTTGGSRNSLFGSNWQSDSSWLFVSTTSSSMVTPSVFQFGSSASVSASIPSSSPTGSLFGSSSASPVSTFSIISAATSFSPSPITASMPVTGSSNPAFTFGSSASLTNSSTNNNSTSMVDTMAEDAVQTAAHTTFVFGQPHPMQNSVFSFVSPSPSVTSPGTGIFQFGGQPSPAISLNQTPLQASGSFNAGGAFSLGSGGGDKSGRKIVKVKRNPKRR